ncbi:MAG: hypothetical protein HRT87_09005 [Legionellales bacterium]|nr:hypothetical protein [Legionellales bacterium]
MKIRPRIVENDEKISIPQLENEIHNLVVRYTTELALYNVGTYSKIYSVIINPAIKALIEGAMILTGGNQSEAARLLGVSRGTIRHYLKKFFGRFDVGVLPNKHYDKLVRRAGIEKI